MKRCPKCNRSFPDDNQKFCTIDGGLLVTAEKAFDPNATIQGNATVDLNAAQRSPSNPLPDYGATVVTPSQAPTVVFPKNTGPTGQPTSAISSGPITPPPVSSGPIAPPPNVSQSAATAQLPSLPQSAQPAAAAVGA